MTVPLRHNWSNALSLYVLILYLFRREGRVERKRKSELEVEDGGRETGRVHTRISEDLCLEDASLVSSLFDGVGFDSIFFKVCFRRLSMAGWLYNLLHYILIALSIAFHAVLVDNGVHGTPTTVTAEPVPFRSHFVSDEGIESRNPYTRNQWW